MAFRVRITPSAKHQLDMYVRYTKNVLKNCQAAHAIIDDAEKTKKVLSEVALSMKLCEHPVLKQCGYRKIAFTKHSFFMIYRVIGNTVIVEGMYHELQDYEGVFINGMKLK